MESYQRENEIREDNPLLTSFLVAVMEQIFDPVPVPMILIDSETRVRMINKVFADFLVFPREELIGRKVYDIDKNTRFPQVFATKRAEIAWKHRFANGHAAIVHRIPVLDEDGAVKYGFGMVFFQDMEEFRAIIEKNRLLETEMARRRFCLPPLSQAA